MGGTFSQSAPVLDAEGTLYMNEQGGYTDGYWSGRRIRQAESADAGLLQYGLVVGPGGTVYTATQNALYAVDVSSQQILWSAASIDSFTSVPVLSQNGAQIFAIEYGYRIRAFDARGGSPAWTVENTDLIGGLSIGPTGTLFAVGETAIYAYNPVNGQLRWSAAAPSNSYAITLTVSVSATNRVYFFDINGILRAWNGDTGASLWTYDTDGDGPSIYGGILGADGTLYIGSNGGIVYAFSPDGTLLWQYDTEGGSQIAAMVLGPNGLLSVTNTDGMLYTLR